MKTDEASSSCSDEGSETSVLLIQKEQKHVNPQKALTDCIFSQYGATFAAVSGSTAYAVARRPPNGLPLMLVAGAVGSLLDMTYAWNFACTDQVQAMRKISDDQSHQ